MAEVRDRDGLAADVHDPAHVGGRGGDFGDLGDFQDFAHVGDGDGEKFIAQAEGEVLIGFAIHDSGLLVVAEFLIEGVGAAAAGIEINASAVGVQGGFEFAEFLGGSRLGACGTRGLLRVVRTGPGGASDGRWWS